MGRFHFKFVVRVHVVEERAEDFGREFAVDSRHGYLVDVPHTQTYKCILAKYYSAKVSVVAKLTLHIFQINTRITHTIEVKKNNRS